MPLQWCQWLLSAVRWLVARTHSLWPWGQCWLLLPPLDTHTDWHCLPWPHQNKHRTTQKKKMSEDDFNNLNYFLVVFMSPLCTPSQSKYYNLQGNVYTVRHTLKVRLGTQPRRASFYLLPHLLTQADLFPVPYRRVVSSVDTLGSPFRPKLAACRLAP